MGGYNCSLSSSLLLPERDRQSNLGSGMALPSCSACLKERKVKVPLNRSKTYIHSTLKKPPNWFFSIQIQAPDMWGLSYTELGQLLMCWTHQDKSYGIGCETPNGADEPLGHWQPALPAYRKRQHNTSPGQQTAYSTCVAPPKLQGKHNLTRVRQFGVFPTAGDCSRLWQAWMLLFYS